MTTPHTVAVLWMLDSSTFINAIAIERVALLVSLRKPIHFSEYVLRFELGVNARQSTRAEALNWVNRKLIGVESLTLPDLDRIAALAAPRRIGIGEVACAIIAERCAGGVLCDDWRAKGWLEQRTAPHSWDSIEGVLLDAAAAGLIGELDLVDFQKALEIERYKCRVDLRMEHLQRQMNRVGQ
jgi:hypothetical protein